MTHAFCPSCGLDLTAAAPVDDGPVHFDGRALVTVNGVRLPVQPHAMEMVGSLMRANGGSVQPFVLAERLGYEGDDPGALIAVLVNQSRRAFERLDLGNPIETINRIGYRWKGLSPCAD